ncbi:MAG: HD domain-containing protein [Clostridia bacterium]|nr:HD domain-containing protein [Clostridia bacterium]
MRDTTKEMLAFVREMDKMKGILRANMMLDGSRHEDDAQHSWHASIIAMLLADEAGPDVDIDRAIKMLLVHDIVEVDAGDTYAYDEKGYEDKEEREQRAADRLFPMAGRVGAMMRELWEEFEACQTPTAQYAAAIDRLQPLWGNFWVDGKVWKENNITLAKVQKRNEVTVKALPQIWRETEEMLDEALEKGYLL